MRVDLRKREKNACEVGLRGLRNGPFAISVAYDVVLVAARNKDIERIVSPDDEYRAVIIKLNRR